MLAQKFVRPLIRQSRLPSDITAAAARSFIVGFPRKPTTEPLDPIYYPTYNDRLDPGMNGGYVNPPAEKRQFRDPYADWWDKQGRRNFGEPVHEDDDMLGRFSLEEYTFTTPGKAFFQAGCFIATVFGLCSTVYMFYPDKPAVPRSFPHDGLEIALGGPKTLPALSERDAGY